MQRGIERTLDTLLKNQRQRKIEQTQIGKKDKSLSKDLNTPQPWHHAAFALDGDYLNLSKVV